jgi:hypothetical protein
MSDSREFVVVQPVAFGRKSRKKGTKSKIRDLAVDSEAGKRLTYHQFRERYSLEPGSDPTISDTIDAYVKRNNLQDKKWAKLCPPFDHLLGYLGAGSPILWRLIFSICDKLMRERSFTARHGVRRIIKGPQLRKITVKEERRRHGQYLASLKVVIDHLRKSAPFLMAYPGDENNPLSGTRERRLLEQLEALQRAEMDIEKLRKEDKGRSARYAYDRATGRYIRVGTTITDPITVLLIYVWKAKEERSKLYLSREDFNAIAIILEFLNFFPSSLEGNSLDQVVFLRDRIKRYRKMNIRFHPSGWAQEYHPMVYIE